MRRWIRAFGSSDGARMSTLRAVLDRTRTIRVVPPISLLILLLGLAVFVSPGLRERIVRHPLDVGAFLVVVVAIAGFWAVPSDLPKRLRRNPLSITGFTIITLFIIVAALAPVLAPPTPGTRDPYLIPHEGFAPDPLPPRPGHPLGTTGRQYDLYYGIIWGTRTAFRVAVVVVAISIALGLVLGVVVTAVLGKGLDHVMIAIALVGLPLYARLLRGDILSVKQRDYVEAARAMGAGDVRIIFRHVIPNAIYPFMVVAAFDMGVVVLVAAALSFLGLGAEVGYADWGQLINMSRSWILGVPGKPFIYWYTVVFPGTVIFLFVLGWNLLGDAFRDILDPRLRGSAPTRGTAVFPPFPARPPRGAA